jgi:8-oxo-dGTP diphosphatase
MIDVVAAIMINHKNEILIARRKPEKSQGGLWEFPGGKIEQGETPEESLKRELKEEMNIEIEVIKYFGENVHHYEKISIRLIAYKCRLLRGDFTLSDHDKIQWVNYRGLENYQFAPADIPLVSKLLSTEKES